MGLLFLYINFIGRNRCFRGPLQCFPCFGINNYFSGLNSFQFFFDAFLFFREPFYFSAIFLQLPSELEIVPGGRFANFNFLFRRRIENFLCIYPVRRVRFQ